MSIRRRHTGRVKIDFATLEQIAAQELARQQLIAATSEAEWKLTRHSALHRCKDGSYTLCLVWHGSTPGRTLTSTMRGIRLEGA